MVALVETHGRPETAALLEGLEQLPRRSTLYRGRMVAELDIDALLARKPAVALIDELAHTNVPGGRHPKRWQDVMEVLDAGIDVVTTVNVQHIESLNDAVARITGIRVQETVPDEVLQRADDIELIDLTPEELTERLKAGKVYVPSPGRASPRQLLLPGQPDRAAGTGAAHRREPGRCRRHRLYALQCGARAVADPGSPAGLPQ